MPSKTLDSFGQLSGAFFKSTGGFDREFQVVSGTLEKAEDRNRVYWDCQKRFVWGGCLGGAIGEECEKGQFSCNNRKLWPVKSHLLESI